MNEVELSRLHGIINGLRAELAAEKERAENMPIVLVDVLLSERERCAKIAETFESMEDVYDYDLGWSNLIADIAAAIRASNAAPPHVEPAESFDEGMARAWREAHVEPSAAESEREAKLEGWDSYDQKVVVERIRATWPAAQFEAQVAAADASASDPTP